MTSRLEELAERVGKLTGPCRETDALIAMLVNSVPEWCRGPTKIGQYEHDAKVFTAPAYTASLDAAMTLARTPQEACQATQDALREIAKREFLHCRFYTGSFADDLARNVSATLIRARAASEPSHGG